jgi:hypothetical protein
MQRFSSYNLRNVTFYIHPVFWFFLWQQLNIVKDMPHVRHVVLKNTWFVNERFRCVYIMILHTVQRQYYGGVPNTRISVINSSEISELQTRTLRAQKNV